MGDAPINELHCTCVPDPVADSDTFCGASRSYKYFELKVSM